MNDALPGSASVVDEAVVDRPRAPGDEIKAANDLSSESATGLSSEGRVAPPPHMPPPREVLDGWQPLTADLHRLHVTVTKQFLRKLVAARDALAHFRVRGAARSPVAATGRYAEVLEEGIDLILRRDERNKAITSKPRKDQRPCASDAIPARVRREVGERDRWECQYPLDSGGICGTKRNVQIDHIQPRSRGGAPVPGNLRVLCAHHNALAARLTLGDEVMDPFTRRGRRGNKGQ